MPHPAPSSSSAPPRPRGGRCAPPVSAAALAVLGLVLSPPVAGAATVTSTAIPEGAPTLLPVETGGVCVPVLTCPTEAAAERRSPGTGGPPDQADRLSFRFGALGLLSGYSAGLGTQSAVAPAAAGTADELQVRLATWRDGGPLLELLGDTRLDLVLRDVTDGTTAVTLGRSTPLPASSTSSAAPVTLVSGRLTPASGRLVPGRAYRLEARVRTGAILSAALLQELRVWFDDASIVVRTLDAPTVAGATNVRARTVSFDRAVSTTSAVVEVLDGGTVVSSTTVPTASSGAIALPATDGTYAVRVLQRDIDGNEVRSAEVPTRLDTTAPDIAASAAAVSPAVSSTRERVVTLSGLPSDGTPGALRVLDAAGTPVLTVASPPWSGGAASFVLPAGVDDGTYRVAVDVADAAGNTAELRSPGFVLDRVAPTAGRAPTWTPEPASPGRGTVSFDRAPDTVDATVVVTPAGGGAPVRVPVPPGASTVVLDLPAAVGTYLLTVEQTDAAGNTSTTPSTTATRAPTGGGTPNPNPNPNPNPTLPFPDVVPSLPVPTAPAEPERGDPGTPGAVLSGCLGGEVVLTSVVPDGRRVRISGVSAYARGTRLAVVDQDRRLVGFARVGADGRFAITDRSPRRPRSGPARYQAGTTTFLSTGLRVRRANALDAVSRSGSRLVLRGRLDLRKLGRTPRFQVRGGRGAAACAARSTLRVVGRPIVDRRTGAYRVTVATPRGSGPLVLRTVAQGRTRSFSVLLVR